MFETKRLMTENKSDNISLPDLKIYAANVKSFYQELVLWITRALKTYWYILLLGIIMGGGLAYYKFKNANPYFEGKASFTFSAFNKKMFGEMTDKLRGLSHSGSYKTLSEKLGVNETDARKIIDIEALNMAGSPLSDDITEGFQPFYIRVTLWDKLIADTLLIRLESYLNNNPQVKKMILDNSLNMTERMNYITEQIKKLDSLKTAYQFYIAHQNANSGSVINTFNPVDLYNASEKLMITKTDLGRAIINYKVVKILDPFIINDIPFSPSLFRLLIKYVFLGLLIACLLGVLLYAYKYI